jgi:hypothetical protein
VRSAEMAPNGRVSGMLPATLGRERLLDAFGIVNAWLTAHIGSFSPLDETDPQRLTRRTQSLGEICLYLHLARVLGLDQYVPDAMASSIGACVTSPRFRDMMLRAPSQMASLLLCALPYDWRGTFGELAASCRRTCRPFHNEAQPFQTLCMTYIFDQLGLRDASLEEAETLALRSSSLWRVPSVFARPEKGAYAFTHSVFYATHFGTRDAGLPARQLQEVSEYIEIELCKAFSQYDLDIALEMVLAHLCLFGTAPDWHALVVESAVSLLEEKGYIRSPPSAKPVFESNTAEAEWEACYHTMAVLGLVLTNLVALPPVFACDRLGDDRRMKHLALAMDAVGTVYSALDGGNLGLACAIMSKFSELPPGIFPIERALSPAIEYIEMVSRHAARDDVAAGGEWSLMDLSRAEFGEAMEMFDSARAAFR